MTDREPTPPPAPPAGAAPRVSIVSTRNTLWTAATIGLVLLLLGVWLVIAKLPQLLSAPARSASASSATTPAETRKIRATLFYVSNDGSQLVSKNREVPYGATSTDQIRKILEAQLQPPIDGSVSTIPAGATVRAVFLGVHNEAYVDLSGAIAAAHSGGSLDEALTVYAIVNAVIVNVPEITSVQILIDGHQVDTLAGHIDLRYPLSKALDWIQKGQ